jgi:Effector Associated Constant Component 1
MCRAVSIFGGPVWREATNDPGDDRQTRAWLVLRFEPETDDEDAERLTRQLRSRLADLDLTASIPSSAGPVPDGTKSGTAIAVGELVVTLSASGGVVVTLIGVLRDWLNHHSANHRISVTIGKDTVQLERSTPAERERLIEAFIRAHDGGA